MLPNWDATWWRHFNITMTPRINVRLFDFNISHGLVRVCDIELSHMGKNNGNPDLVCEKILYLCYFLIALRVSVFCVSSSRCLGLWYVVVTFLVILSCRLKTVLPFDECVLTCCFTVTPVLSGYSKNTPKQTLIFNTNYLLMQVKRIA